MKRYVDVLNVYTRDGTMIPKEIYLDKEHSYVIDRVKKVEKTGIWSNGKESFTYLCEIKGRSAHLYYGPDRWYVYLPD